MAPSFLSKLVKVASPTSRERRPSESSSPRTSDVAPPRRSQSSSKSRAKPTSPTTPTQANPLTALTTTNTPYTQITINKAPSHTSFESDTASTQVNVTVVPPSPLVQPSEFIDDDTLDLTTTSPPTNNVPSMPTSSAPTSSTASSTSTPTPTPAKPQNLSNGKVNPAMASNASLAPNSLQVRKKSSTQSMKSVKLKKVPSELNLNVNLPKTATATAPVPVPADGDSDSITKTEIVESPSDIKPPLPAPIASSERPTTGSTLSLAVQRQNTDAASISSKSNRPWRRSSARKPTGLASAIAASGLAMANPGLSQTHHSQMTPPIISPQQSSASSKKSMGSPPYMSISPAQSSTSQRTRRSVELSPRLLKPKKSTNGLSTKSAKSSSRQRKSSISINSDNGSEYHLAGGDETRPEYYSGLDGSSDSGSDLDSDLELGDDDIPVTGFAVASNKRNADFHDLFPTIPEGDYLIEDYGCALQREILIQGRLYISENHICFHANIFGWITDLSIPIYEITTLEKKMTAFVIPNAIQMSTRQAKYTFASFLSRDTTFDVIYNIWRLARPEDAITVGSRSRSSMDVVPDSGSTDTPGTGVAVVVNGIGVVAGVNGGVVAPLQKATLCACGKDGTHYSETAMDVVMPGTPDRIHNLMFASGFMKDFMAGNQKLLDIQMSDWSPVSAGSKLLTRNMSYIKPLTASLGPKQTKCEITDETVHTEDDYISTVTTTRTPDVPSGGVFSVKTRTCVMWASPVSSRVIVTTQVEWTGRSFIKGIIERSAIDGQKVYHSDLEKAMRLYIQEHQSEFLPEGIEPIVIDLTEGLSETIVVNGVHPPDARMTEDEFKQRERERNQRGLQWAWDTFEGASQVAKQSTQGALELVRDAWDQSSSTTILWFVIVILLLSNVWTLMRMGASREEASRKLELRKVEEREKWVQSIVTALWEELATANKDGHVLAETVFQPREIPSLTAVPTPVNSQVDDDDVKTTVAPEATMPVVIPVETPVSVRHPVLETTLSGEWKEVEELQGTLDAVEQRLKELMARLKNLESLD